MKELTAVIADNPYYWSPDGPTLLTTNFDSSTDFSYIKLLLKYPVGNFKEADLFQYLDQNTLNFLKNNKTILVFDSIFEGFGPDEVPIAEALYQSSLKYNIDPKKVFLFTGNLTHRPEKINVIPIFLLAHKSNWAKVAINGQMLDFPSIKECRKLCETNYEKIILSLSRRNRFHRVLAHCMLFNSDLREDSIISQDKININFHDQLITDLGLTKNQIDNFINHLPLIADKNQFDVNDPFNWLTDLHSKSLFSIVNETLACNLNDTTFFFSEKFLKPIINFQPMLIYGHQGINKKLTMLGFKTYEEYFNLDFDDEPNDILRYKKLLISTTDTVKFLKTLNREQQIEWRFKKQELLQYNFNIFLEHKQSDIAYKKFLDILKDIN